MARFLGVHLTENRAWLVESSESRGAITVHGCGAVEFAEEHTPEQRIAHLQTAVKQLGIKARSVRLVLSPKVAQTVEVLVPPMGYQEMRSVVQRELRKNLERVLDDYVYDYAIAGKSVEKGTRKLRVQIVAILKRDALDLVEMCRKLRWNPQVISLASYGARQFCLQAGAVADGPYTHVHFGREETLISIFEDGNLVFSREVTGGLAGEGDTTQRLKRLLGEVKRSILFFNQTRRSAVSNLCHLTGALRDHKDQLAALQDQYDLEIQWHSLRSDAMFSGLPEIGEVAEESALAVGASVLESTPEVINLIPYELVRRRARHLRRVAVLALLGGVIAAGMALYAGVQQVLSEHRGTLSRYQQQETLYRQRIAENLAALNRFRAFEQQIRFVDGLARGYPAWELILGDLGLHTPPEVVLRDLRLFRERDDWKLVISGTVEGPSVVRVQAALDDFMGLLRASPYLSRVWLQQLKETRTAQRRAVLPLAQQQPEEKAETIDFFVEALVPPREEITSSEDVEL
jgi:hypothetical protein